MLRRRLSSNRGFVLITVLLVLAVVGVLGIGVLDQTTSSLKTAVKVTEETQALYAANAGIEYVTAYLAAGKTPVPIPTTTVSLGAAPKPIQYTVSMQASAQTNIYTVTSVGTVGSPATSTRTIRATVGNMTATGYYKAVYSGGQGQTSVINNNILICGDVYSADSLTIGQNTVIGKTGSTYKVNGKDVTCPEVAGAVMGGTAVAVESVIFGNDKAIADGGWCDGSHVNQPPCNGELPEIIPEPPFDFSHGNPQWQEAVAAGRFFTGSRTFGLNQYPQTTGGSEIYWVDGTLNITGFTIRGKVTFVAANGGIININGTIATDPVYCASHPCSAAYISQGQLNIAPNNGIKVYGALITTSPNGIVDSNNVEIHGSITTPVVNLGNNSIIYSDFPFYSFPPPGLPGAPGGVTISGWSES